ncbi:hypothetical protein ES319_A13G143500v1 [Gossypium barbadense]|uniref:Uncharacterized protein n=1 Tax=Gossypium barbadense TaxID=3634 RepID=A0A5J5T2F1_GOSBA|nr:hypothetical protein ES319_A13G143500v1 [Gossypium barbadense]
MWRLRQGRDRKTRRCQIASPINQEAQNEMEKRVLACHLKDLFKRWKTKGPNNSNFLTSPSDLSLHSLIENNSNRVSVQGLIRGFESI